MCGGCDEQVHHPSAWLAAGVGDSRREAAIADNYYFVDGQCVEVSLQRYQPH